MNPAQENQPPLNDPGPNRPEGREPAFNIPGVVLLLMGLCTGLEVAVSYVLTPEQAFELLVRAAFIPDRTPLDGFLSGIYAWTSTVTYAFLHGGWSHLLVNMVWLAAFGSPLANRLGVARFLLFWLVASWGAVGLHYALHAAESVPLVGASGAISGMMGAAARFGFRIDRSSGRGRFSGPPLTIVRSLTSRTVVVFLAIWMVINFISGLGYLTPGEMGAIAWEAHIGGFLVGFFLIGIFGERRVEA